MAWDVLSYIPLFLISCNGLFLNLEKLTCNSEKIWLFSIEI